MDIRDPPWAQASFSPPLLALICHCVLTVAGSAHQSLLLCYFVFCRNFCASQCVYGGGTVFFGGGGGRRLATVTQGVAGDRLPWGGEGQGGEGRSRRGILNATVMVRFTTHVNTSSFPQSRQRSNGHLKWGGGSKKPRTLSLERLICFYPIQMYGGNEGADRAVRAVRHAVRRQPGAHNICSHQKLLKRGQCALYAMVGDAIGVYG